MIESINNWLTHLSIIETLDIIIALGMVSILLILLVLIRQSVVVDKLEEIDDIIATSLDSAAEEKKVIHCWEDHPDAPLECICKSGRKEKGAPCILTENPRH